MTGLRFISDDARILHLMPAADGTSRYHYHVPVQRKLFGFIPRRAHETISIQALANSHRAEIIACHYDGQHEQVCVLLREHGSDW